MAATKTEATLVKRCDCGRDKWKDCKHPWTVTKRRPGQSRLWVGVTKYLRAIGDAKRDVRSWSAAAAVATLILNEAKAGTLAATLTGHRRGAPTTDPAHTSTTSAGVTTNRDGDVVAVGGKHTITAVAAKTFAQHYEHLVSWKGERDRLRVIRRCKPDPDRPAFGDWPVASVTADDMRTVYGLITAKATRGDRGNSSRRKYRRVLRKLFTVAIDLGWIAKAPIADAKQLRAGVCGIRKRPVPVALEQRLIDAAITLGEPGRRLAAMIIAATECGARKGELLAIKVGDVTLSPVDRSGAILIAAKEDGARKSKKPRVVPISRRLYPVIDALLVGPDGHPLPPTAYVFGNAIGERVRNIDRIWQHAVLIAHGGTPTYGDGTRRQCLTTACWAIIKKADLKFHDLRHECALRWHRGAPGEKPVELNAIAELLGHKDLAQLRVYLGIEQDDALAAWRRAKGLDVDVAEQQATPAIVVPFRRYPVAA